MTARERLQRTGIRRTGSPASGFRYFAADGRPVAAAQRRRIDLLRVPPAWTDVHVAASPRARLQAIGRDRAGRWQYRYHDSQARRRERSKGQRLLRFLLALPRLRRRVAHDLALPGLPRAKVMACIVRILSTCFLRPGSQVYASDNGSYGIATLRRRHVRVRGAGVAFDFEGKGGRRQQRVLVDRDVARVVQRLRALPGHEVFKFLDGDGRLVDVRRRHINAYIKAVMGEAFSAKDFRTWAGTLVCACTLTRAQLPADASRTARQRQVVAALDATAAMLGNTRAVCRASYVHAAVLRRFEAGQTLRAKGVSAEVLVTGSAAALRRVELALVELLRVPGPKPRRMATARVTLTRIA